MEYKTNQEIILFGIDAKEQSIPEVKLTFSSEDNLPIGKVRTSIDVANIIREIYPVDTIELQEQMIVLYLDQANNIKGYYRHSQGSINGTIADIRIILAGALKSLSVSMIIAHNHPSGNLTPSDADIQLTKKFLEAAKMMEVRLLDHLIITKNAYYSFADEGRLGLSGIYFDQLLREEDTKQLAFVKKIEGDLKEKVKHNKTSVEKIAFQFGIEDKTEVKELTELAIVRSAKNIAQSSDSIKNKYRKMVDLYNNQVNLSHRTSQSILLQQYSTPAPIAYLAGLFTGLNEIGNLIDLSAFEPSAGNGLLTIAFNPGSVIVNEIDEVRRANLQTQGFKEVLKQDATMPFPAFEKKFDVVLTNPPFGSLDKEVKYDTYPIKALDHLMALRALDTMKDSGRASIIIGGHTKWDEKGRILSGRNLIFFNYLYSRYNVIDVIQIDGQKLYSKQGTAFDVRLILIAGRKDKPQGAAPVRDKEFDIVVRTFEELYERVYDAWVGIDKDFSQQDLDAEALALEKELDSPENLSGFSHIKQLEKQARELEKSLREPDELGAPYQPASDSCIVLNTVVPDSMEFETQESLQRIKQEAGGDMDEFVRKKLHYSTKTELCKALSAEQIDAVAMAIYNIEYRRQGMIIGDQTGIGKGRVAASMIRYAVHLGVKPIFITEKANLFSDIYRDLAAIGSDGLVPFIVNGREPKTDIKDEDGNVIYQAMAPTEQNRVLEKKKLPGKFDFILGTYSQFNSPETKPLKPAFLEAMAEDNIIIMDESHNASGSSNTGEFFQTVLSKTLGVVFLSATFAKRPDNMPVYAMKTAISDANMSKTELVDAILKGGVALQEILASQLVAEGQMIRRERSFEGVEVNYINLDAWEEKHRSIADNVTEILREIISFQTTHIDDIVDELDDIAVAEGKLVDIREGTTKAGVDNLPYFSKVFNVINQMLFSIKAEAVADRAIERLKEGKKPVIAFASTMGSFIEQMENAKGLPVSDGDLINADFGEVLQKGLDGIMRYTITDPDGEKEYKKFSIAELPPKAQEEYLRLSEKIKTVSIGITISPIDIITKKLKQAGYIVAEVTGRKYELQINPKTNKGVIVTRKRVNTNDAFRQFNNNEVDVLLINQSGSTGASAHAIITPKVPKEKVKQRVMIVLQAELDINTEVQKRGRINRTGQIMKPIYDYMISAIPAEKRLMMMLQKKLKSLDANTTSNQKQSTKILDVPDFLNKYGDKIVAEYLKENPEINQLLDDPLELEKDSDDDVPYIEDAAHKVSGRVAVLSTKMQQDFYNEISIRYNEYVEYLKQTGDYDLEVEAMNLEAETINSRVVKVGKGGDSMFGDDSILETVRANVLKKPFAKPELENLIKESLSGKDPEVLQNEITSEYQTFTAGKLDEEIQENEEHYKELSKNIPNEKKIKKILKEEGETAYQEAIEERKKELDAAKDKAAQKIETTFSNRKFYLDGIFNFFYIGRNLNYVVDSFSDGQILIPAVFIGFMIDKKKKNPYAPSALRLRFAIANSHKYIAIPASYSNDINAIKGASIEVPTISMEDTLDRWEEAIKKSTTDRSIRYIVTGNLLQAFSEFKGKLVSYTTSNGTERKGILMPEHWTEEEGSQSKVSVPISRAIKIIRSLGVGSEMTTSDGFSIFRQSNGFKLIVAASRQKGGEYYLDKEILELVTNNKFEKVATKMTANLPGENIDKLVDILQRKFNAGVTVSSFQFDMIKDELPKRKPRERLFIPPKPQVIEQESDDLELEALALEIELELLNFAA